MATKYIPGMGRVKYQEFEEVKASIKLVTKNGEACLIALSGTPIPASLYELALWELLQEARQQIVFLQNLQKETTQ